MSTDTHKIEPQIKSATLTLITAGYSIKSVHRQPSHIEYACERKDVFGATVSYLFAISDKDSLLDSNIESIEHTANTRNLVPIIVTKNTSPSSMSWADFVEALGGAVPSWQALSSEYEKSLICASNNVLPKGMTGEAWLVFEDLVAHGLEFIFGRKVRRLGGRSRGRRVSDMQGQLPNGEIIIVDAKATKNEFDGSWSNLRPLIEYVEKQKVRQKGHTEPYGALVVSSQFKQDSTSLLLISRLSGGNCHII